MQIFLVSNQRKILRFILLIAFLSLLAQPFLLSGSIAKLCDVYKRSVWNKMSRRSMKFSEGSKLVLRKNVLYC